MLAYTTYSEAGGVGKTSITAALADEHTRDGRNVLTIDLDPQYGSLTHLLGVDAPRDDSDADNIVRHMIGRPNGDFEDLIHETEFGFDIIPNHNMLERLGDLLNRAEEMADDLGESFDPNDRLLSVLSDANVANQYDTLLIDPPATSGPHLYNAVNATRSLVIPVEPTGKGVQSIDGLEAIVDGIENSLDVTVGVLAVVPNGIGSTSDQQSYLQEIRDRGYPAPVAIRERSSLMDGCWDKQCPSRHYVENHRSYKRDYEMETLDQFGELAESIEGVAAQ